MNGTTHESLQGGLLAMLGWRFFRDGRHVVKQVISIAKSSENRSLARLENPPAPRRERVGATFGELFATPSDMPPRCRVLAWQRPVEPHFAFPIVIDLW